jgi:hypothetical protein
MSALSEQDHLSPNDPNYYAPRWLRDRSEESLSPSSEATEPKKAEPIKNPTATLASLDHKLENAVSNALWRPLDPEVIYEPPGFEEERDRRRALISVASRFAAAVGVSAVVALFFVFMIPSSRDHAPDVTGASSPGTIQSIKAALFQPSPKDDGGKPAISEFKTVLAGNPASQPVMTHEQSETLLQQFKQWRQKAGSTGTP